MPAVITDADGKPIDGDASRLAEQAAQSLTFELSSLPPNAVAQYAQKLQAYIYQLYKDTIASGNAPGFAVERVNAEVDRIIRQTAQDNGIQTASQQVQGQQGGVGADPNILPGQNPGSVNSKDVEASTQVYRDAINDGKGVYDKILSKTGRPDPSAIGFFEGNRVRSEDIAATTIGGPSRNLTGVLQDGTTVETTDTAGLQDIAAGRGAGQQLANARYLDMLQRNNQTTNAQIQMQRGAERKGMRRAEMLAGSERALTAGAKIQESDAKLAIDATTKLADLDARRKEKQAELDAARRSGDADRIQRAEKDMLDVETEIKKFNAQQTQTANTGNVQRAQDAQGKNLDSGLTAIKDDFQTWKQTNELAIQAQKALEESARGLLNEDQRQQTLTMARKQLAQADAEFEYLKSRNARAEELNAANQRRQFWGTMVTTLVAAGVTLASGNPAAGAAAGAVTNAAVQQAAHGGAVDKATQLLVGEAGDHELVIPIKGKLSDRMLSMLSVESQPFNAAGPEKEIDSMPELMQAIKATMNTAPKVDDDMTSLLAAATLRARRGR
jgi:hypothetical protein